MSSSSAALQPTNSGRLAISDRSTAFIALVRREPPASGESRAASEAFYHLVRVLHLRRLRKAVAHELAPFLEIGRAAEVHRMVLQRLPFHEQPVAAHWTPSS